MASVVDNSNKGQHMVNKLYNHRQPYEIPQECKNSWDLMKNFIADRVFDKKTKESKHKAMVLHGLLSCFFEKMAEIIKQKDKNITEKADRYETLLKQSNEKISELKMVACHYYCETQDVEKKLEEHKHAVYIAFDEVGEKSDQLCQNNISKFKKHKQIYPWNELYQASSFPAAPVVTTTVLNTDNTGEVHLIPKQLKPQEIDVIVIIERLGKFMKWFCEVQRVRETCNLNSEDVGRILQKVVGNGLWVSIVQNCGQQRRTRDVFREMMRTLYGITLNVSLSGKIKQMKQECPYELCDRIVKVMDQLLTRNPGFEHEAELSKLMCVSLITSDVIDQGDVFNTEL
ncbi:hypothetical protein XELAEV_18033336mg [Xenopus laevis]|uniref:Uncharacterized protein n=1 Tax=Xenopus laevis TaxID=8355 RepID=A0A974CJ44_XENLA|nr:hypothetical protein XELAEV_18033336mg [Xenopus laevis]